MALLRIVAALAVCVAATACERPPSATRRTTSMPPAALLIDTALVAERIKLCHQIRDTLPHDECHFAWNGGDGYWYEYIGKLKAMAPGSVPDSADVTVLDTVEVPAAPARKKARKTP